MVAMSGGVDSSAAALLLKEQGYDVVGMTAELFGDASAAGPCCGREGSHSAKAVCDVLGVPHHHVDLTELFEEQVIGRFIGEYRRGRTPNPCSDCNRFVKFDTFFEVAERLGCELIATGHHARIIDRPNITSKAGVTPATIRRGREVRATDEDGNVSLPLLATATDSGKDQSYFLACIPPQRLAQVRFPVGEYKKEQVRALALSAGLPTAHRDESQDICFIANEVGIRELLEWHTGEPPRPGPLVDDSGNRLGEHAGIEHYTVGQRRGLNLGGGTEGLVVHRLEHESNTVVLAQRDAHPVKSLKLRDFTDMAPGLWRPGEIVQARGRYRQQLWEATMRMGDGTASVEPEGELFSMAPGQWCVGYRGDAVLFGGIIDEIDYR